MNTKIALNIVLIIQLFLGLYANATPQLDGKMIFVSRCAACHSVNLRVVGPALANVDQRHSMDWIIRFIHSSQTLVKGNDKEALAIFHEFNQTIMPDHPDLSDDQVKSIVDYIKSATTPSTKKSATVFTVARGPASNFIPLAINNYWFFGAYVALVLLMVGCLVLAVRVRELMRETIDEKKNS